MTIIVSCSPAINMQIAELVFTLINRLRSTFGVIETNQFFTSRLFSTNYGSDT